MIATPVSPAVDYTQSRINWSDDDFKIFGLKNQLFQHSYHELSLFSTENLIDILDKYPREWLQVFTMGSDPTQLGDWQSVDIHPSTSGAEIWQAVEKGRLWLNLIFLQKFSQDFADLVGGMYDYVGTNCPHLKNPQASYTTLLISSPGAQVYFHMDQSPNMLWHISGQKRLWVYPPLDLRLVPQTFIEELYAGEVSEFIRYERAFDQYAESFLLTPGTVVSWPHNAPHRIENLTMNVSLTTSYYGPHQLRRERVQKANRYILRNLGIKNRSMREDGIRSALKRTSFRVLNKIKPFKPTKHPHDDYVTDLQIDPTGENGIRKLDKSVVASFSKHR